jgi:hypothetical protein
MTAAWPSSLTWFLVDEGMIGEFLLPPMETLPEFAQSLPES